MHHRDRYSEKLNHFTSLGKCLGVSLRTKWLWVRSQLHSVKQMPSLSIKLVTEQHGSQQNYLPVNVKIHTEIK